MCLTHQTYNTLVQELCTEDSAFQFCSSSINIKVASVLARPLLCVFKQIAWRERGFLLLPVCQQRKVGENVGENRDKLCLSPTVCQHVSQLFPLANLSLPSLVWKPQVRTYLQFLGVRWEALYKATGLSPTQNHRQAAALTLYSTHVNSETGQIKRTEKSHRVYSK